MLTEISGVVFTVVITILLSYPLGKYISKVFMDEKVWTDFLKPVENFIFRIAGINPDMSMDWKQNMKALLGINLIFFVWAYLILVIQGIIPWWNPSAIANMEPTLAFNTAASFVTNTNLQHYAGERDLSYFSQVFIISFLQYVSAGTGIAAMALLFKGLIQKQSSDLGNFYNLFLKSCTRILLPLSLFVAILLILNGTPATFDGPETFVNLQGDTVTVATGPVAQIVSIKQIGTNGGGFFGPNSAHPFENPDYFTNIIETFSILIIPMALVFAFGFYADRKKTAFMILGVMTAFYFIFLISAIVSEIAGNPKISELGIDQSRGSMEGKELRFGSASSALWGVSTTSTSNGSVNSMHDSQTPLSGAIYLFDMMINAVYGGVGVGFINFFLNLIIAIFIAGLMVGRTPELFGKKIEAHEIKIASLVILVTPLLVLAGTAIASHIQAKTPDTGWLNNPSYHGFSEMLYEFTSSNANNGSGFEGLGDNTPFWNIGCGLVILLGRFIPIIGPIAIAGSLSAKKHSPESEGSLKIDTLTFGIFLFGVIVVLAGLSFFPALSLGPVAEYFSM